MNHLFKCRKVQLQEEAEFDKILSNLIDVCPITIATYYLKRRDENRQQYFETLSSNMLNIHKKSLQNLKEIDDHHSSMTKILNSKNVCNELSYVINETD